MNSIKRNFLILGFFSIVAFVIFLFVVYIESGWNTGSVKKIDRGVIDVGVIASNPSETERYQEIINYLNKYSDDKWSLVPLKDYGSFKTAMWAGQIEAGFVSSAVSYMMIKDELALPVAQVQKNGESEYYGYIFARKDSGIRSIDDLRDKKFAFVDIYTAAGYFCPRRLLKDKGYDPENYFRLSSFLGSHEKAVNSVFEGDYDAGAAKSSVWNAMVELNPEISDKVEIISKSGPFPEQTFMLNADYGVGEVNELKQLLLDMEKSIEGREYLVKFGIDKFIEVEQKKFIETEKIINF